MITYPPMYSFRSPGILSMSAMVAAEKPWNAVASFFLRQLMVVQGGETCSKLCWSRSGELSRGWQVRPTQTPPGTLLSHTSRDALALSGRSFQGQHHKAGARCAFCIGLGSTPHSSRWNALLHHESLDQDQPRIRAPAPAARSRCETHPVPFKPTCILIAFPPSRERNVPQPRRAAQRGQVAVLKRAAPRPCHFVSADSPYEHGAPGPEARADE